MVSLVILSTKPTKSAETAVMVKSTNTIFFNELFIAITYFLTPKRFGRKYLLMRGVAAFMMNIANDIPSG